MTSGGGFEGDGILPEGGESRFFMHAVFACHTSTSSDEVFVIEQPKQQESKYLIRPSTLSIIIRDIQPIASTENMLSYSEG